jgi:hypothetical protein
VNLSIAKKLREKGFPQTKEGTLAMYDERGEWYSLAPTIDEEYSFESFDYHDYVCPTISQVLKWLREGKKIFVVIAVNPTLATKDKMAYYYQVYSNSDGVTSDYYESEESYAQCEDCAIDSIKYVLDNLI